MLRGLKAGEISDAEAIKRLERSPDWVWTAMDPTSKLLVVVDVGSRTLAMAQRVVHQVTEVLAPGCALLFLTDGFKEYGTAILAHFGSWIQPERRQDKGPMPQPRWMPLPELLYAQGVKSYRRRRMVRGKHRVAFGTHLAVEQVLAVCGWTINTSFVERLNLDIRQRVAAIGRRVNTICQGEKGLWISWYCFRPPTILYGPTPGGANRYGLPKPPRAEARRRCGGRVHRPWRQDSLITSGRCEKSCSSECHRGLSHRCGNELARPMIVRRIRTGMSRAGKEGSTRR
ncbi:MAG: hypothetical protein AB7N91_32350 [Candidatus Tectimicrobiota bacterium]